jgi:hypothetical protein
MNRRLVVIWGLLAAFLFLTVISRAIYKSTESTTPGDSQVSIKDDLDPKVVNESSPFMGTER